MSDNSSIMPDPTPSPAPQTVQFERSPFYRAFYTNFFRYLPTPTEFNVTFSRIVGAIPGGAAAIVDEAEMNISYVQLKILYDHLSLFLSIYEREFGAIERPLTQNPDATQVEQHIANLKIAWGRT
jgi:hypothetical protein